MSTARPPLPSTPLLVGESADAARRAIVAVADGLWRRAERDATPDPTLTRGVAGDALLYAHLARAGALFDGPWRARAEQRLELAIERLSAVPMRANLFTGFTGIAWAVERVTRILANAADVDDVDVDPNADLDDALLEPLQRGPWTDPFDLVEGLVGIGVYALERRARPHGAAMLDAIIARLGELARVTADGLAWVTPGESLPPEHRALAPHGYVDLGVAHGVPGVIALLGHAAAHGVAGARALLDGSVAWLLAHERPAGASRFPRMVPIDHPWEPAETRVAWCNGDLGVSIALLGAARRTGHTGWEAAALRVARHAATRPLDQGGAWDACLCHGAAGNGHLLHRLYRATGDQLFADAARAWLARALTYARPAHPLGGFRTFHQTAPGVGDWRDNATLLTGSCGVALALQAAIDPRPPAWDRLLLVDLPPGADQLAAASVP